MAFVGKKDYCGLGRANKLVCVGDAQGASGSLATAQDDAGSVVASTYVDGGASASNTYDVVGAVEFKGADATLIKLGTVNSVGTSPDQQKFMLTGVSFGTSSTDAPSFSASAVRVESGATTGAVYALPAFTLPKRQKAVLLFQEAELGGTGCHLTSSAYNASASGNVKRDECGVEYASDIHTGMLTATLTIIQTGSAEPTVTADTENGWAISSPLTQTNSKSTYPTWTVSLELPLVCTEPSASA